MPADAMMKNFGGKKRPPKFEDEGTPSDSDMSRGGGSGPSGDSSGADSAMPDDGGGAGDMPDAGGPPDGADPEEKSVDDMSDILGVGPEDREDFANALKTYVHACVASIMAPAPGMGGMPPDVGGPESEDTEGPESSEEE